MKNSDIFIIYLTKLFNICLMYIQCLTTEDNNPKHAICSYISDTSETLKQSQRHQTYNNNVEPKQGYYHAKF